MPPPSAITSVALSGTSLSQPSPSMSQHSIMSSLATPSQTLSVCPLGQDQLVVDTPLVVSSALPPVPGKLVKNVQSGMFVDMKEILSDNVSLLQRLGEISSGQLPHNPSLSVKLRVVPDILTWVYCFLEYISIQSQDKFTRDLVTYARVIVHLAQRHGGKGWLDYDKIFRLQTAANPSVSWGEINPSLMAATVLVASSGGTMCLLCHQSDHQTNECALQALEDHSQQPPGPVRYRQRLRPSPLDDICRRFNKGLCKAGGECKYRHTCSHCFKGVHPALLCPEKSGQVMNGQALTPLF